MENKIHSLLSPQIRFKVDLEIPQTAIVLEDFAGKTPLDIWWIKKAPINVWTAVALWASIVYFLTVEAQCRYRRSFFFSFLFFSTLKRNIDLSEISFMRCISTTLRYCKSFSCSTAFSAGDANERAAPNKSWGLEKMTTCLQEDKLQWWSEGTSEDDELVLCAGGWVWWGSLNREKKDEMTKEIVKMDYSAGGKQ